MDKELQNNLEEGFEKLFNTPVILKKQRQNKALKKKALFLSLIEQYETSIIKSARLQAEFGMDLFEYEETYYSIIDKLMLLMWGESGYDLISFYLHERIALDGSINCLFQKHEDGTESEVELNTPEDLYSYLVKINPNFLNEK
jgi:hypothetical protein